MSHFEPAVHEDMIFWLDSGLWLSADLSTFPEKWISQLGWILKAGQ